MLTTEIAQEVLTKLKIVRNTFYQDEKMSEVLASEGILSENPISSQFDTIAVDRIIEDKTIINLDGNLILEIISTPGHSLCGIACYISQDQAMMVSDVCGFQVFDTEIFPLFFQSYELYI